LEVRILLYYLKIFSLIFFFIFLFIFKIIFFDRIEYKNNLIEIKKNQNLVNLINKNIIEDNSFKNNLFYLSINIYNRLYKHIHYGTFQINNKTTFFEFLNTISYPSKYLNKITIVEGWNAYQLNDLLKKNFNYYQDLNYLDAIADTYLINQYSNFYKFKDFLKKNKDNLISKYSNHNLLKKFSFNEIMVIASLVEKEGIDYEDKKKISSVIFNRLNKKMKLQIDATVIYSITKGKHKFTRTLTRNDLKIKDIFNTYYINYLPPKPICYVGTKTIELIFENYNSDYLYYFYDKNKKKHDFSKSYSEHLIKLNEYRKKNK